MRFFGAEEYGQFSLLLSQSNLIVALGFGWLNQAQLRYFSNDSFQENYKISQIKSLLYSIAFCLIIITIFVLFQSSALIIWMMSVFLIIAIGCFNYIKTIYQAKLSPKKIIYLMIIQSLMALLIPLFLMQFIGYTVSTLIIGVALSFILSVLIVLKFDMDGLFNRISNFDVEKNVNMI